MTPSAAVPDEAKPPGARLGLPAAGAGAVASWGSRLLALAADWALANAVAVALVGTAAWSPQRGAAAWLPLLAWAGHVWLATATTGASIGQHLVGLRVIRLDRRRVGLWPALIRTVLIGLVVPPLVWDADRRGLHDRAVGTVVVRGPRSAG